METGLINFSSGKVDELQEEINLHQKEEFSKLEFFGKMEIWKYLGLFFSNELVLPVQGKGNNNNKTIIGEDVKI